MRHPLRTLAFAMLTAFSLPAVAGRLLDLEVVDRDTGETLRTYYANGKSYVVGVPGHRYSIELTNRTRDRVLAVLSVDGVNAINGQTASPRQAGYVLDPHESTEVTGWRKSMDEVAQFEFTALPDSYAARTGRPANVGVIGVAVFTERTPYRRPEIADDRLSPHEKAGRAEQRSAEAERATAAPMPAPPPAGAASQSEAQADSSVVAKSRARPGESLGTGHGDRETSLANRTTFERASTQPAEIVSVWYDSYDNLAARGIVPRPPRPPQQNDPDPFPRDFVPDPPRRR